MTYGNVPISFSNATSSADTTLFVVDYTNVTEWLQHGPAPTVDDRYMLQWFISWGGLEDACKNNSDIFVGGALPTDGAVTFNIQTEWGKSDGTGWQGEIQDVRDGIPECPEFGAIGQIGPPVNATQPACADVEMLESRQGTPCAVKVDQAAASSISSRISSTIAMQNPTTRSTAVVASSTSKAAGAGNVRPVQTALAAACVLCSLAL